MQLTLRGERLLDSVALIARLGSTYLLVVVVSFVVFVVVVVAAAADDGDGDV